MAPMMTARPLFVIVFLVGGLVTLIFLAARRSPRRANSSNLLHVRGAGQGFREKLRDQRRFLALAGDAQLLRISLQQAQRQLPQDAKVLGSIAISDAALIFVKTHIQLPM